MSEALRLLYTEVIADKFSPKDIIKSLTFLHKEMNVNITLTNDDV